MYNMGNRPFHLTHVIDFRINNGTNIGIAVNPLTFILSPVVGGEGRVRGAKYVTQCSITFAKFNKLDMSRLSR